MSKPTAEEELKRLEPLELPVLNMAKWKSEHPWYRFFDTPSGTEIAVKTGIHIAVDVAGHYVRVLHPVGWILLGYKILDSLGRDERAREAQVEAWNAFVWERFWADERLYPSASMREAAFDSLVGDNTNHGIVPRLTEEAELKRQELIYQANVRWLAGVEAMHEAKKDLDFWGPKAEEAHAQSMQRAAEHRRNADLYVLMDPAKAELERRWAQWAEDSVTQQKTEEDFYVHRARDVIDSYKADMKAVLEFEANPANWDLTPEQRGMLNNLVCDAPGAPLAAPGDEQAVSTADDAEKIYDVVGGRPQ